MAKIQSAASIKVNTGNFESLDFSTFIEFEFTPEAGKDVKTQIMEKSMKLNAIVIQMLKQEVEDGMKSLGRERFDKEKQKRIPLWDKME